MASGIQSISSPVIEQLTGRFNVRRLLTGKLVLQVEEDVTPTNGNGGLNWIAKGGGYYSECNKRLKG